MALVSHWATAYGQEGKPRSECAIPSASICCLHLFAAQQWKVFEDNGLDVEIIQMRPQVANAAMIAGETHYFAGVGPNSVAAIFTRGMSLPGRLVCFRSTHLLAFSAARVQDTTRPAVEAHSPSAAWAIRLRCRCGSAWKQPAKTRKTSLFSASEIQI